MYSHSLAKAIVSANPDDVKSYLQSLNPSQSDLKRILERGLSGRHSTIQNHPKTSRG